MALRKKTYTDGVTVISSENLNEIQDAVIGLERKAEEVSAKTVTVALTAADWVEVDGIYTQVIQVGEGSANALVALQPTDEQMLALLADGVSFLKVDNDGGVFTAKAGGSAPSSDMTIQATLTGVGVYGQPISFGGSSAPELIWENASPGSSFAPQTLSFEKEWSAYLIEMQYNAPKPSWKAQYVPVGVQPTNNSRIYVDGSVYRVITSTASSSVVMGKGYDYGYEDGSMCVPSRVWGLKFTL